MTTVKQDSPHNINSPSLAISMIGILFGLLTCLLFLPSELRDPDGFWLSAVCLAFGIALGPLVAAVRTPASILHPLSILALGLIYWVFLDLLQSLYLPEVASMGVVAQAFVALALFAIGVSAAQFFRPPALPKTMHSVARTPISGSMLYRVGLAAFVLSFLRFAIPSEFDLLLMYKALFLGRWSAPWARGALGGVDAFLDHLTYFGYVLPPLAVLTYRSEKRIGKRTILLTLMAIVIGLLIAQGGGRRIIGTFAASAGVCWVLTAGHQGRSLLLSAVFGLPAVLVYLQFMLLSRNAGFGADAQVSFADSIKGGIRVDDNFNRLAQLIEIIPARASHAGFDWIVWVLSRPIPRVLWPGKPLDPGFDLPSQLGLQGVSLTSSIVGEAYMAFGMFGCLFVGLLYGLLGRSLTRLLAYKSQPSALIMYAVGLLALFVGLRSGIELVLFCYPLLVWIVIVKVMLKRNLAVASNSA